MKLMSATRTAIALSIFQHGITSVRSKSIPDVGLFRLKIKGSNDERDTDKCTEILMHPTDGL